LPVYVVPLEVPAKTPREAPVERVLEVEEPVVAEISVFFPPGCFALTHVQVFYGELQLAPKPVGASFTGDGLIARHPTRWFPPEVPFDLRILGWNEDVEYKHTPLVFITTEEVVVEPMPVKLLKDVLKRFRVFLARMSA